MKKKTYIKKHAHSIFTVFKNHIILSLVAIFIVLFFAGLIFFQKPQNSNAQQFEPETTRNMMKKIPQDVKKILDTQLQPASPAATFNVPILLYHYVEYVQDKKDTERQKLNVNPNVFEIEIQTLLSAGYTFITVKDFGDVLDGIRQLPPKPIIMTFDDGHWDLDTYVLPILKKYNVKATAYIVSGFVGTNSDSLTPLQLQDVINSGLIDIGAHTVTHMYLKGRPLETVKQQIIQSKETLEQTYHVKVYSFAYPYGAFDQQAIDIAKQAGFTTAASTVAGNIQSQKNRYFLFRIRPGYLTGQALLHYVTQTWKPYQM